MFIYRKTIDRSTLRQGFQIPVESHYLLMAMPGGMPLHGETRNIKVLVDDVEYNVQLKNQGFDSNIFKGHADVIQIRYNEGSPFAKRLREIFSSTWNYVNDIKALPENVNRKVTINVPEELQEYLVVNATELPNVFVFDCYPKNEKQLLHEELKKMSEFEFEHDINMHEDTTAGIKEVTRVQKVRKLDRSIGDSLKQYYDYRCQMTGEKFGDGYGCTVVEAHHIIPFTQSLNNNPSNIIIISPNYHRIIHQAKPEFDFENLEFIFPNGVHDRVMLNKHLGK